jgi:hypothetical protein
VSVIGGLVHVHLKHDIEFDKNGMPPAGQKNRYTQSTQSCLDAIVLGQIEPELKKTKWAKISDFLSLFLAN